ncbi:MAG: MFS transporter, partial [Armatimonadota bacterium]
MSAGAVADRPARFGALRHRNFALFWIGLLVSHTGTWMQQVGSGWLVYQLTNTPVWLGLTSLAFAVPMVVLPLFGGAVADRFHRVSLIRNLQLVMAAVGLGLAGLIYTGTIAPWHLLTFNLIQGVVLAFENPARHALLPELVGREHLMSAISLFQSSYQLGGFFGPALAGVILGAFGDARMDILFALNALTVLVFAGALSLIRGTPRAAGSHQSLVGSLTGGVRFVWAQATLRALLILVTIIGVFGRSYVALLPVFARDVLATDARGLGYITAAPGIGVIVGATALSAVGAIGHRGRTIVGAGMLFATILAAFALSRWMPLSIALLVLLGMVTITLVSATSMAMQLASPDALRGRVMSL